MKNPTKCFAPLSLCLTDSIPRQSAEKGNFTPVLFRVWIVYDIIHNVMNTSAMNVKNIWPRFLKVGLLHIHCYYFHICRPGSGWPVAWPLLGNYLFKIIMRSGHASLFDDFYPVGKQQQQQHQRWINCNVTRLCDSQLSDWMELLCWSVPVPTPARHGGSGRAGGSVRVVRVCQCLTCRQVENTDHCSFHPSQCDTWPLIRPVTIIFISVTSDPGVCQVSGEPCHSYVMCVHDIIGMCPTSHHHSLIKICCVAECGRACCLLARPATSDFHS